MDSEKLLILLDVEEVKQLHDLLSSHYYLLGGMEPVTPTGVKDMNMLLSAIGRQQTSCNGELIYNTPYLNCATLVFGIVKNHAFHNGNKRVGFLCLLKHLYSNNLVLNNKVGNSEIYELLKHLASSNLKAHAIEYYRKDYKNKLEYWTSENDNEQSLNYLAFWIKQNSVNKNNFIKNDLKVNELKKIIESKHLLFSQRGRTIKIEKRISFLNKILGKNSYAKEYNLGNSFITVKREIIKTIRKDFDLNEENGFDNTSFYSGAFIDEEVRNYKVILNKLSKT